MIEGLNLHEVVGEALAILNPWQTLLFKKVYTNWTTSSREPTVSEEYLSLQGKIQPASTQDIVALGWNLNEYQYYRCYLSANITQLDRLRQLGCDTFTDEKGDTYRMVAKEDWIQNGWREGYCYLDEANNG